MTNIRNRWLFLSDLVLLAAAPFAAYAIRFAGTTWSAADAQTLLGYTALAVVLKLGTFWAFGMYSRLWRHASIPDLTRIVQANVTSTAACALLGLVVLSGSGLTPVRVPISVAILDSFLTVTVVAGSRLLIRAFGTLQRLAQGSNGRRVLIVGAGAAGEMILRELQNNPQLNLTPVGFVDDDPAKHNHRLNDLPVLGSLSAIHAVVAEQAIDEIVIALPTAPGSVVRQVVRAAAEAHIPTRTVPALFEILSGRVSMSTLRKVEIQDLLRREPVQTNLAPVRAIVSGHSVLVTGAGGSIGSELARQLAQLEPAHLVLLGNGENEIFDILSELKAAHPSLQLSPVIADVRDLSRMRSVFQRFRPHAVFHAAAHKHVPLMEENAADAVTNNVQGTQNVVRCAAKSGTQHFVLISTDKAVRPTSVMGATKRVAEMAVQQTAARYKRNFVAVRFGNVLGSRCSVVPIFLSQIRAGGPVTITHPDMQPIRIVDLATDLIRLSGLEVGRDIEIRYTGIRPGERLYEEPFFRHEEVLPTRHAKVLRARNNHLPPGTEAAIESLTVAGQECRSDEVLRYLLKTLVPDFGESSALGRSHPVAAAAPARRSAERRLASERRGGDRRAEALVVSLERRAAERRNGIDRRVSVREESLLIAVR